MIQGRSNFVYKLNIAYLTDQELNNDKIPQVYVSKGVRNRILSRGLDTTEIKFLRG